MAATAVLHRDTRRLRHTAQVANQVLDGFACQIRLSGDGFIEIGHVGRVVFVMVNFHCPGVDMWFERIEGIREGRQFEGARWGRGICGESDARQEGHSGGNQGGFCECLATSHHSIPLLKRSEAGGYLAVEKKQMRNYAKLTL